MGAVVRQLHGADESWLVSWRPVGVAGAPEQDQLRGEVADPAEFFELVDCLGAWGRPQRFWIEPAIEGSSSDPAQPLRLATREPGKSLQIDQSLRGRKGEQCCSREHDRVPELL